MFKYIDSLNAATNAGLNFVSFYRLLRFVSMQRGMLVWHAEPEVFTSHDHEQCVEMTRCRWSCIGLILSLYVALFPPTHMFVQCTSPRTNLSFVTIGSVDNFIMFENTQYNADNLSFTIDASGPIARRLACVKLLYKDMVQMKNHKNSGNSVASFRTSFTFSITQQEGLTNRSGWIRYVVGFVLTFVSENITSLFQSA